MFHFFVHPYNFLRGFLDNLTAQESPPSGKWSVDTASLDNRHLGVSAMYCVEEIPGVFQGFQGVFAFI